MDATPAPEVETLPWGSFRSDAVLATSSEPSGCALGLAPLESSHLPASLPERSGSREPDSVTQPRWYLLQIPTEGNQYGNLKPDHPGA